MNGSALVLAAHGSRSDERANSIIHGHAERVAVMTDFDEVAVGFHHGLPTFATVLDTLNATDVTVVPMMTSEGYFSTEVLPRELRRNRRYPLLRVRQTKPMGFVFSTSNRPTPRSWWSVTEPRDTSGAGQRPSKWPPTCSTRLPVVKCSMRF